MKKLSFILSGLLLTSGAFAQLPAERVILDYDKVLPVSSSVGDKASSGRNVDPSGINESKLSGKYVHRNQWVTEEQQCGYKNTEFIKNGYVDLRDYTGIEYKVYVPADTKAGLISLDLRSDGLDFGPGDPNIQRENWERQFIAYSAIPLDVETADPLRDQWFKVEHSNIMSGRKLGMVAFGYRRGEMPTTSAQEIVYFDDFIMKLKNPNEKTCLFRETFFLLAKESTSWESNPNAEIVQYPGTSWSVIIETGADRWVSGYEPKTDLISLEWEGDAHDHILVLDKGLPEINYEGINVEGFTNLKLDLDVKGKTPKVEYQLDGGAWTAVNIGTIGATKWTPKSFDISTEGGKKVNLRLSGKEISAGAGYIDNLSIYGNGEGAGLMNASVSKLNVYPNPVTDVLNVSCDSAIEKIELYNANGNMVYAGQAENGVDVSNLSAGIYVVKAFTAEGVSSAKVMKQ